MSLVDHIAERSHDIVAWRHDLHRHPELLFDVHRTADMVARKLAEFGCDEVVTGIGRTGVVGVIKGRGGGNGRNVGLRADMDALPIHERTGVSYQSCKPGLMHACGHDGHCAMLLGAARHLCSSRNFSGNAILIFQPAEEGGGGARVMIEDGLLERFQISEVFGMHNAPGVPVGNFAIRAGEMMASIDRFEIEIKGVGGHAAKPNFCVDPIHAAGHLITSMQSIVARTLAPTDAAVVSITTLNAGDVFNVIPETATLSGTVRTLNKAARETVERRLSEISSAVATAHGAAATVTYTQEYPILVNDPQRTDFAAGVARMVAGDARVDTAQEPVMGGEDFAFLLEKCPGSFIFVGNGDSAEHHHAEFDFDDKAIPFGASYWVTLVEQALPA